MKYLIFLPFLLGFILICLSPLVADAYSPCPSMRKGHCMRLEAEDSLRVTQGKSYLLAAIGPYPGLEFLESYGIDINTCIGDTLSGLYKFVVGIAGTAALVMFVVGGIQYMVSGESPSGVTAARKRMMNAIYGLLLIATSYLVLYTINPDFSFKLDLKNLSPIPGGGQQACIKK
ncbi:MAG: pilin [Candidatus Sungbacteria bacterium]|nr:pilin [bacterium]MDZ4260526.1 pilin [Candidatus Sungbacteria bacterium]